MRSTPESGARAFQVAPADAQDLEQVAHLAQQVQEATGATVTLAHVEQGYTGAAPRGMAADVGIALAKVPGSLTIAAPS